MTGVLFISGHAKANTGAHYRFDRLVSYSLKNNKTYWLTPKRMDIDWFKNVITFDASYSVSAKFSYLLFLLSSIASMPALFKERKSISNIIVFGEYTLTVAMLCKLLLGAKLSIGIRSNVMKRYEIQEEEINGLKKYFYRFHFLLKKVFLKIAYLYSDQIVVQSADAKETLISQYGMNEDKVIYIHNDLPSLDNGLKEKVNNRTYKSIPSEILFVGNPSKIKGLDILIKAFIEAKIHNYTISVAGVNKENIDYELLKKIEKNSKIVFLGPVTNVLELMLDYDLLVVPSREDQFPNVVLEALATKTPVVGSNVDGIKLMLNSEVLLFEPDVDCLSNKLRQCANEEYYSSIISTAVNRASGFDFHWEEKYLQLAQL
ncbi:MAG: glycosyltransferase [Thiopseudomonas sp.]